MKLMKAGQSSSRALQRGYGIDPCPTILLATV